MAAFGLVFGKFLASVGDETSGTTIINGMFGTVLNFSGMNYFINFVNLTTFFFVLYIQDSL